MYIHGSVPPFYCLLKKEFIYNQEKEHGKLTEAYVFGIRSIGGRAIGFNLLTEEGGQFANIPIHALVHKKYYVKMPLKELQLWDCFGEEFGVEKYEGLDGIKCFMQHTKKEISGNYMFTIDWANNAFSDEPSQHKQAHVIKLNNGCFAALPNNRMRWHDPSFTTKSFYGSKGGDVKPITNTHLWRSEQ